jgi:hypothetical protein
MAGDRGLATTSVPHEDQLWAFRRSRCDQRRFAVLSGKRFDAPDLRRLTGWTQRIIRSALRSCRSRASCALPRATQDPSISGFFHRYPAPLAGGRPTGFRQSGTGHENQEFHQGVEVSAPRQPCGAAARSDLRHQQDAAPLQGTPGLIPDCHGTRLGRVFSTTLKIAVIRANITVVEV